MRRTIDHRTAAAAAALGALLTLGACAPGTGQTTGTPTTAATVTTDDGAGPQDDDLGTRLAGALGPDHELLASLATDAATTITPLGTPWLTGWQVLDVLNTGGAHPVRSSVALSDDDRAVVLTGAPEEFVDLLAGSDVRIEDPATAASVAEVYLDATRSFRQWSQRVASVDEIPLRPDLDPAEQAVVDAARTALEGRLGPTAASPTDDGFEVVVWLQDGGTIARHTITLTGEGVLTDDVQDVVTGLPVPLST